MTESEIIALVNSTVTSRLAAASRPWQTVPAGTPTSVSELVGLNNPDDNVNIRFSIQEMFSRQISNPSNNLYWAPSTFILNGNMINGQPTVTGLGSTSRVYVGMTVTSGVFPSATIISIQSSTAITLSQNSSFTGAVTCTFQTNREGNDGDGHDGSITKPFATYEKCRTTAIANGATFGNSFNAIYLGANDVMETLTLTPFVNIIGNNAYIIANTVEVDGLWEDSASEFFISDVVFSNSFLMDLSGFPASTIQKTIWFNNVRPATFNIAFEFKGNGIENFVWTNSPKTHPIAYPKSLTLENFNAIIDIEVKTNPAFDGITSVNSTATVEATEESPALEARATTLYISKDADSDISVSCSGDGENTLITRASITVGDIAVDSGAGGGTATWNTDVISYKTPTLLNGATVEKISEYDGLFVPTSTNFLGAFFGAGTEDTSISVSGITMPVKFNSSIDSDNNASAVKAYTNNANHSSRLVLVRGRGTEASPAAVVTNDGCGIIQFAGINTSGDISAGAYVGAIANGAPTSDAVPMSLFHSVVNPATGLAINTMFQHPDGSMQLQSSAGANQTLTADFSDGITLTSPTVDISGVISSGEWNGDVISGAYGGTGVNNGVHTITLGGTLETSQNVQCTGGIDVIIDSSVADTLTFNSNIKFFDDAQNIGVGSVFPNITSGSTNIAIGKNCGVNITSGTGNFFIGNVCDVPGGQGNAQHRIAIGNNITSNYDNTMILGSNNITAIVNQNPNNCSLGTTNQTFKSIIFGVGPGDNVEIKAAPRLTYHNAIGTIPDTGASFEFDVTTIINVNTSSQTLQHNNRYYIENAAQVSLPLPATCPKGGKIEIRGGIGGSNGFKITQAAGQSVIFYADTTTVGTGGSVTSDSQFNSIDLECIVANTTFMITGVVGAPTLI